MATVSGLIKVFLQPGDWFVANADYQISTLLGSCVSITLWHPATQTGGMSHFLLPTRGSAANGDELDGRYGDEALQLMIDKMAESGVPASQCQAKIFGGGSMFPGQSREGAVYVGQRNGQAARGLLLKNDIAVVSECLFGIGHRQVIFDVCRGDVWSRQTNLTGPDA
jgi:chemotaxis protein CheD